MTHGVTLGYLEQNAMIDPTLDIYGEMRSCFARVLDAMAQMQILERRMAASPEDASLLEQHDALQNIIDAADGYNMDVNIKKALSGMGFAQDTWTKNVAVRSGGELTRLRSSRDSGLIVPIEECEQRLDATAPDGALLRPHIVFFGESVPMIERAAEIAQTADIMVVEGT